MLKTVLLARKLRPTIVCSMLACGHCHSRPCNPYHAFLPATLSSMKERRKRQKRQNPPTSCYPLFAPHTLADQHHARVFSQPRLGNHYQVSLLQRSFSL